MRSVLITGAAGGIGAALAEEHAGPDTRLLLHGRTLDSLKDVADRARARGAQVICTGFDILDIDQLRQWLVVYDAQYELDLVIANAGLNIDMGSDNSGESWEDMQRLFGVNVHAAIATAHAVLPGMRARGEGQIALISSLAAWRGLPETPSYCASKAAVKVWGEAMRDAVMADGVKINVVTPGYVESKMARAMPGPKPFMWSADKAARYIRLGLTVDRARISFPFPLNLGCFLLAGLHPAVAGRILRWLNYSH